MKEMTASELVSYLQTKLSPPNKKIEVQSIHCIEPLYFDWPTEIVIRFEDCVFEHKICMLNSIESCEIVFNKCEFKGNVEVITSNSGGIYRILNSLINQGVSIENGDAISLFMGGSKGKGEFVFDNTKFEHCSLKGFRFDRYTIDDKMSFLNCAFNNADFRGTSFSNTTFNNSLFSSDVSFDRSTFNYIMAPCSRQSTVHRKWQLRM